MRARSVRGVCTSKHIASDVELAHLRILLVQRSLASFLQIDVENIVVALTGDYHDLRSVVAKCYHSPNRSRGCAVGRLGHLDPGKVARWFPDLSDCARQVSANCCRK